MVFKQTGISYFLRTSLGGSFILRHLPLQYNRHKYGHLIFDNDTQKFNGERIIFLTNDAKTI